MDEKELKEIFLFLQKAGANPQLCDTEVPYFEASVRAGLPTENWAEEAFVEMMSLPRKMLASTPAMIVDVNGDSMLYYKQQLQKVGANVVGGVCLGKTRHTERTTDELLEDFKEVLDLKEEEDCQAQLEREEKLMLI